MIFLTRYELGESVTVGILDTFLARDILAGDQVLVHIFAGTEVQVQRSLVEWALLSFHRIAPPPPGMLLDAGRCEQSSKAYLITKVPSDSTVLQRWIQSYRLQTSQTKYPTFVSPDHGASAGEKILGAPAPIENRQDGSEQFVLGRTGEFTRLFRPAVRDLQTNASAGLVANSDVKFAAGPERVPPAPGEITQQFSSGMDASPTLDLKDCTPQQDVIAGSVTAGFSIPPSGTVKEGDIPFPQRPIGDNSVSIEETAQLGSALRALRNREGVQQSWYARANVAKPRTENFTEFFRGPFGGQATSSDAVSGPEVVDPAATEHTGGFTRVFGASTNENSPYQHDKVANFPLLDAPKPRIAGAFTGLFGTFEPASSPSTPVEEWAAQVTSEFQLPEGVPNSSFPSDTGEVHARSVVPELPVSPRPAEIPAIDGPLPGGVKSGATELFVPFGRGPAMPTAVPSGPSEFTRIISSGPGGLDSPARQVPPAPVPVQPMQYLPSPQFPIQYPPVPPVSSGLPQVPRPALFSYWPLVIVLNVLLIAAVALVVYFALKH